MPTMMVSSPHKPFSKRSIDWSRRDKEAPTVSLRPLAVTPLKTHCHCKAIYQVDKKKKCSVNVRGIFAPDDAATARLVLRLFRQTVKDCQAKLNLSFPDALYLV